MNGSKIGGRLAKIERELFARQLFVSSARRNSFAAALAVFAGAVGLVAFDVWALKNVVQTTGEGILIVALAAANVLLFTRAAEIVNRGQ